MDNIEPTALKKTWQKPDFWILDSYIEGGTHHQATHEAGINGSKFYIQQGNNPKFETDPVQYNYIAS